jgi:ABC-type multidrug transport system fused ATPase/permease subunit
MGALSLDSERNEGRPNKEKFRTAYRDALNRLSRRARFTYFIITTGRVLAGGLDLAGVIFVSAFSARALSEAGGQATLPTFIEHVLPDNLSPINYLLIGVVALGIKSATSLLLVYGMAVLLNNECGRLIKEESLKISEIKKETLDAYTSQRLHYLITAGLRASIVGILSPTSTLISELLVLVSLVGFLILTSVGASILSIGILATSSFVLFRVLGRRQYRLGQLVGSTTIRSVASFQESIHGYRELITRGTLRTQLSKFSELEGNLSVLQSRQTLLGNLPRYSLETVVMLSLGAIATIATAAQNAQNSLLLITVFSATTARILPSLIPIQSSMSEIQANLGMSEDFRELRAIEHVARLQQADMTYVGQNILIQMKDVSYVYPGPNQPVLNSISLEMKGPGWFAIDGPSGSGKSTLFDLLLGVRTPTNGSILICNQEPRMFVESHPGVCSYLPQRISTTNTSIAENVAFGSDPDQINVRRVEELLSAVGLEVLLQRSHQGIWLPMGELGSSISGGQLQRLGIARCLYTNPKLLLLDESTSGLDHQIQEEILDLIQKLSSEILVVSISHDQRISKRADHLMKIDNGRIEDHFE